MTFFELHMNSRGENTSPSKLFSLNIMVRVVNSEVRDLKVNTVATIL